MEQSADRLEAYLREKRQMDEWKAEIHTRIQVTYGGADGEAPPLRKK